MFIETACLATENATTHTPSRSCLNLCKQLFVLIQSHTTLTNTWMTKHASHELIMIEVLGKWQPRHDLDKSLHSKKTAITFLSACGGLIPNTARVFLNTKGRI